MQFTRSHVKQSDLHSLNHPVSTNYRQQFAIGRPAQFAIFRLKRGGVDQLVFKGAEIEQP